MKSYSQHVNSLTSENKNYFFISPLPLIDVVNPALTLGYERFLAENFSIQLEGGPILRHSLVGYFFTGLGGENWWTNKGGKLRAELKLYKIQNPQKSYKTYYGVEFFWTDNMSNVNRLFEISEINTEGYENMEFEGFGIYRDYYMVHRERYGFNLKIGIKESDKNNMTVDSSIGIGVAIRNLIESGRSYPKDDPYYNGYSFLKPGRRVLPSITMNIKIGLMK